MQTVGPAASLLVIAACHPDVKTAIDAWSTWCHSQTERAPEAATGDGSELLPTVAYRLSNVVASAELEPAIAARRQAARSNMKLLAGLNRSLAALNDIDVHPIVLKGGAMLSSAVFNDLSARWLSDIDILIEPEQVSPAFKVFAELGFKRWPQEVPEHIVRSVMHAAAFADNNDFNLDVHWTLLHYTRCTAEDRALRVRADSAQLGPTTVRTPDRTDMLLHTLAHANLPDHRWLVDAAYLLDPRLSAAPEPHSSNFTANFTAKQQIDFDRLAATASLRRYLSRVTESTAILATVLPGEYLAPLQLALASQVRRFGDAKYEGYGSGSVKNQAKGVALMTINQLRDRSPAEALRFVADFPRYLSYFHAYPRVLRKRNPQTPESPTSR